MYKRLILSSVAAIGDLGHLIGRGAWMSMVLVLTLMPAFLALFDHILLDNEFQRLKKALRRRSRKKKVQEKDQEDWVIRSMVWMAKIC